MTIGGDGMKKCQVPLIIDFSKTGVNIKFCEPNVDIAEDPFSENTRDYSEAENH